ncbi:hypothetical protein K0M31_020030 [Melipona bicolor]|uniref:Uncharacterized protein n=1 Tax=Melipona bicolor TaxID=60889 RepID=A0AA40KQE4_9HYME|nr:hypothetical protein K0M31_020030 [Melipona bicolor]
MDIQMILGERLCDILLLDTLNKRNNRAVLFYGKDFNFLLPKKIESNLESAGNEKSRRSTLQIGTRKEQRFDSGVNVALFLAETRGNRTMNVRLELSALNLRQYAGTVVSSGVPIEARTIPMHGTVFAGNASLKRAAGSQAFETNTTASIRSMPTTE